MDVAGRQQAALQLMERKAVAMMAIASNELAPVDTIFHLTGARKSNSDTALLSAMVEVKVGGADVLRSFLA